MSEIRRIAYVVNAFPVVSETFILNEIRAMEAEGIPIVILPLTGRRDHVRHASEMALRSRRIPPPARGRGSRWGRLRAHASVAARHRGRYLRLLAGDLLAPLPRVLRSPIREGLRSLARRARLIDLAVWIAGEIRRHDVIHIHAHYARDPLEVADRVRRLTGTSCSFAAHAKDLYTAPGRRLTRRLRTARFAVACHIAGRSRLAELAAPEDAVKILHVPHGLDTDLFRPRQARREPGLILAVGRLTEKKGFEDLVEACSLLKTSGRRFRCVVLGEGREEPRLREAIRKAGLGDSFVLLPFAAQEELPGWYARASVLAMPSRVLHDGNQDGIPNVVLEAMACGLPVVATNAGSICEVVVDGSTGRIVPQKDPKALAGALAACLDDPVAAARLGQAAFAVMSDKDFRQTVVPLVLRFREILRDPVECRIEAVGRKAWEPGGLAERATRTLGRRVDYDPALEACIAEAILPGMRANRWRPDLERMIARRLWDEIFKSRLVPRLESGLDGGGRERILDLGCGRGGLSVALRARGRPAISVDLKLRNCRLARLRGRRYGLAIPAVAARAEQLPFSDGSFQRVSCFEVLEHVADPRRTLSEIRRVLADGGVCAITVVNRWAPKDPHYHLWGINHLPRRFAGRYVRWRGRVKQGGSDAQGLEEMHYYSYREFMALASSLEFEVVDSVEPGRTLLGRLRRLARRLSLGYNTATFLLTARPRRSSRETDAARGRTAPAWPAHSSAHME